MVLDSFIGANSLAYCRALRQTGAKRTFVHRKALYGYPDASNLYGYADASNSNLSTNFSISTGLVVEALYSGSSK